MSARPRRSHRLVPALLALVAGGLLALLTAGPAAAHTRLVATAPQDGATLAAAPAELVLTFSEPVLALGAAVVVSDAGGARPPAAPQVSGSEVTAALPSDLAGPVRVAWRVTAADGHPISGEVAFEVAPAPSPAPTDGDPTAASTSTVSTEAPAAPGTSPAVDTPAGGPAPATVSATSEPVARAGRGGLPVGWLLGGTLAVVALAGAGLLLARRRAGSPGA